MLLTESLKEFDLRLQTHAHRRHDVHVLNKAGERLKPIGHIEVRHGF